MAVSELKRKIYFYRVVPNTPTKGWNLDRHAVVKAIQGHRGKKSFYLDQSEDRITAAEVFDSTKPPAIKVYAVRRSDLPSRDDGSGSIGDLGLAETEGLAEAIHLRLFPNSVIGFESFFYGPRITRFETYLNDRCNLDVSIREMYRADVLQRALKFEDIRMLHVKVEPGAATQDDVTNAGLKGALDLANNFDADVYADVTLRAERYNGGLTNKAKDLIRQLRKDKKNPADFLEAFDISGINPETGKVDELNLLNDALQRSVSIPKASERTRALDSRAAFKAISAAYSQVRDLLPKDAQRA